MALARSRDRVGSGHCRGGADARHGRWGQLSEGGPEGIAGGVKASAWGRNAASDGPWLSGEVPGSR